MRKILAAAIIFAGTCGTALALPASPMTSAPAQQNSASTLLQDVQWREPHHPRRDMRPRHRDWRRSQAWDHPRYRGWHRYHARPHDWRARRCVAAGPLWVCP